MDGRTPSENEPNWQFKAGENQDNQGAGEEPAAVVQVGAADETPVATRPSSQRSEGEIEWTASEFIARHKPAGWYLGLIVIAAVIAALVYFSSHDFVAVGAVIIIAILFGVIASRKPRSLTYRLNGSGLSVSNKLYPFRQFKAFFITKEDAFSSLNLLPLRRFMPILTVYYDPADEAAITSIVGDYLPLENRQLDPLDRLLKKIRF